MSRIHTPGKVNLRLKITGVREDGYHLLESIFAPLDWGDELEMTPSLTVQDNLEMYWTDAVPPTRRIEIPEPENLAYKALLMAREKFSIPALELKLIKSLPPGGGLGGASANAAGVLKLLCSEFGLPHKEALDMAPRLGADVSFFMQDSPAQITGIGEIIAPLTLPRFDLVIWAPPFSVNTKQAYSWFDNLKRATSKALNLTNGLTAHNVNVSHSASQGLGNLDWMENDLEDPVIKHHPEILDMKKELLNAGSQKTLMTGSGSSVFGIYKNRELALAAQAQLRSKYDDRHAFFVCTTTE